jgi:hypothetical protein
MAKNNPTARGAFRYRVVTPVLMGGRRYAPGGTVELGAADATALLAIGAVAEIPLPPPEHLPPEPVPAKAGSGKGRE